MKIKGFDKNLCCRGFQFEIGHEYEIENDGKPLSLCSNTVFHYCDSLQKVHAHYSVRDEGNRFCEIAVLGEEISNGDQYGSDHIKILREIAGDELETLKGKTNGNSGIFNTGYRNTGDCNTGDYNTGDRNTGNYNTGYYNTGDRNTGDYNTGYCNTGNYNTGYYNTGDRNTGCFCTEEHNMLFFDKRSDWKYIDWTLSDARDIMQRIDFSPTEWIAEIGMTDDEKEKYPAYKTTGGYLRERDPSDYYAEWWQELTEDERQIIKDIPNFDPVKFKAITGIDTEAQDG